MLKTEPKIAIEQTAPTLLPPSDFVEELRSLTLDQLVGTVSEVARLMEYPDESFDPVSIVGHLMVDPDASEDVRAAIRKKVDGLHYVISEFDAYAAREDIRSKRYRDRAARARRHAERIKAQIKFVMDTHGFEKLAGNDYAIKKTENTFANCSLVFDREANHSDMLLYDFVEEIPATYAWKNAEVKTQLKEFYKALRGQPACDNCAGKKRVVDDNKFVECSGCFGTGVTISPDTVVPESITIAYLEWNPKIVFDDIDRPEVTSKPKKKRATIK